MLVDKIFQKPKFSDKQSLQTPHLGVPWTIDMIFHILLDITFSSFNCHMQLYPFWYGNLLPIEFGKLTQWSLPLREDNYGYNYILWEKKSRDEYLDVLMSFYDGKRLKEIK